MSHLTMRELERDRLIKEMVANRSSAHGTFSISALVAIKASVDAYLLDKEFDDEQ